MWLMSGVWCLVSQDGWWLVLAKSSIWWIWGLFDT